MSSRDMFLAPSSELPLQGAISSLCTSQAVNFFKGNQRQLQFYFCFQTPLKQIQIVTFHSLFLHHLFYQRMSMAGCQPMMLKSLSLWELLWDMWFENYSIGSQACKQSHLLSGLVVTVNLPDSKRFHTFHANQLPLAKKQHLLHFSTVSSFRLLQNIRKLSLMGNILKSCGKHLIYTIIFILLTFISSDVLVLTLSFCWSAILKRKQYSTGQKVTAAF